MLNILLLSGIKLVGIRPYSRTFYNGFPLAEHHKIFFSRKFISMVLTLFLPTTTLLACSRHLVNTAEQNKTKGTMVAVEQNEEACFGRVRQVVVKTEQNKCDSSSLLCLLCLLWGKISCTRKNMGEKLWEWGTRKGGPYFSGVTPRVLWVKTHLCVRLPSTVQRGTLT